MRGEIEAHPSRFSFRAVRVEKLCFQIKRAVRGFCPQVHSEFQFPLHWFDKTGGADFFFFSISEGEFQVRSLFEHARLDIDAHAPAVLVGFSRQGDDSGLLGRCAVQVVFRKEKLHERDYTLCPLPKPSPIFSTQENGEGSLFIEQKSCFNVMTYTLVLDPFFHPLLQVGFFVLDWLSAGKLMQWVIQMQRTRRDCETRDTCR